MNLTSSRTLNNLPLLLGGTPLLTDNNLTPPCHAWVLDQLCARWIEVGAFYPFSRDHSTIDAPPHELYRYSSVTTAAKNALGLRYAILPYLYTTLYHTHATGAMFARPLFANFPADPSTHSVQAQFMLGDGILVTPVLDQGSTSVTGYFPSGYWYSLFDDSVVKSVGQSVTLATPLESINVHVLGGVIVPMQTAGLTTTASRQNPFSLTVPLSASVSTASGSLYLDDGEQVNLVNYSLTTFAATSFGLTATASKFGSGGPGGLLTSIKVLGLLSAPKSVTVNGQALTASQVSYKASLMRLSITGLSVHIDTSFSIAW